MNYLNQFRKKSILKFSSALNSGLIYEFLYRTSIATLGPKTPISALHQA
nr:hypothetical protein [Orientia tsutsugamushi]